MTAQNINKGTDLFIDRRAQQINPSPFRFEQVKPLKRPYLKTEATALLYLPIAAIHIFNGTFEHWDATH